VLKEGSAGALICVAVEGRFLQADDVAGLREAALRAEAEGAAGIFVSDSALGDPFVLAAALSVSVPRVLLGTRVASPPQGRHPTLLAREATSLDLVCGGRAVLCLAPPFVDVLGEAFLLCRAMTRDGTASSEGPAFPVPGAVNRPRPTLGGGPLLALDLTAPGDGSVPSGLDGVVDYLLLPTGDPTICRMERV
jgi:alkanesulfonate monooxygenase SsuD/methylene tetrahydromethanopterin reductase-like flavin-dependent oxidoreductase (luciferase family)